MVFFFFPWESNNTQNHLSLGTLAKLRQAERTQYTLAESLHTPPWWRWWGGLFGEQNKHSRAIKIRQQNSSLSKSQDIKLKLKSTARSSQTNHNRGQVGSFFGRRYQEKQMQQEQKQQQIELESGRELAKVRDPRQRPWSSRPRDSENSDFWSEALSLLHRRQVGWSDSR